MRTRSTGSFRAALAATAIMVALPAFAQSGSQPVAPPNPVVTRPGGDANKSQYEYAPEQQPSWTYTAPGTDADACATESALLRDRVRDLEAEIMQLTAEKRDLAARNKVLLKASQQQGN